MPEKTQPSIQAAAAQASEQAPPAAEKAPRHTARSVAGRSFRGRWAQKHAAHAVKPEKKPQADSERTQQAEAGKTNVAKTTQRRQVKVASLKKREK